MNFFSTAAKVAMLACITSCGQTALGPGSHDYAVSFEGHRILHEHYTKDPGNPGNAPPRQGTFQVKLNDSIINASVDSENVVSVTDYPAEWLGHMTLVRFDGKSEVPAPFSGDHCDTIRTIANSKIGRWLVRGDYRSLLMLDIPIFLSDEFPSALLNSAHAAGIRISFPNIKNYVHATAASIRLELASDAISFKSGTPIRTYRTT